MTGTPIALTIAGSDSSGGAGIQADLKTFSAFGVYGASVITALTAQNTQGVTAIEPVAAAFVAAQMEAVLSDLAVGAIKTGMLANASIVEAVARRLRDGPRRQTSRRRIPDDRHVEIAVQRQRKRAWDGCRRHDEHIRAVPLRPQARALQHAKPMLLVDDDEAELMKPHIALHERMRAHHEMHAARFDLRELLLARSG